MERFSGLEGDVILNYISTALITFHLFENEALLVDIPPWKSRLKARGERKGGEGRNQKMHLSHLY